jgi:hypothetical protein
MLIAQVKFAIQHMRKIVKKKANFDIMDLDTIQVCYNHHSSYVPILNVNIVSWLGIV